MLKKTLRKNGILRDLGLFCLTANTPQVRLLPTCFKLAVVRMYITPALNQSVGGAVKLRVYILVANLNNKESVLFSTLGRIIQHYHNGLLLIPHSQFIKTIILQRFTWLLTV
jgi:hypothetical protein